MYLRMTVDTETGDLLEAWGKARGKDPEGALLEMAQVACRAEWGVFKPYHKGRLHYNQLFKRRQRGRAPGATFTLGYKPPVDEAEVGELEELIAEAQGKLKEPHWFTMKRLTREYGVGYGATRLINLKAALQAKGFTTRKNGNSTEYWITPLSAEPST